MSIFIPSYLRRLTIKALFLVSLIVMFSAGSQAEAAKLVFSDTEATYDGNPKSPVVITSPLGLQYQTVYQDNSMGSGAGTSEIVFNNTPDVLKNSYNSVPFNGSLVSALGNYYRLGGRARMLESCEVTMVNWAKASGYPTLAALNASGFVHPFTLTFYKLMANNQLVLLSEVTQNLLVPWRPEVWPTNGYAFRLKFDFPQNIILPENIMVMISYNTERSGFAPIGTAGPYNSLNVAIAGLTPSVGTDLNPDDVLQVLKGKWYYPAVGWNGQSGPMIRLRATSKKTITPPTNAGTYTVTSTINDSVQEGTESTSFTINKASAIVAFTGLTQVYDGSAKVPAVQTTPPGLAVNIQYSGGDPVPKNVGTYNLQATVIDSNYSGQSNTAFTIKDAYQAWSEEQKGGGGDDSGVMAEFDDPDHDGIPNILEYAMNLPSLSATDPDDGLGHKLPELKIEDHIPKMIYRKNRHSGGLTYTFQSSCDLSNSQGWVDVVPSSQTVVDSDADTQVIEAAMPMPSSGHSCFYRLKVSR